MNELRTLIRDVPDFPAAGILFRDITPLLRDPAALSRVVRILADRYGGTPVDAVAGIESRGFIFAAPLAIALGVGFVPVRKLGKLPAATIRREYALEYGTNHLEMHADALLPGERVLLVDDVLATGGTARAAVGLIQQLGAAVVAAAFLVEIEPLGGRAVLDEHEVFSIIRY